MLKKQSVDEKQYADGSDTTGPKWWESLFGNLGGILGGTASVIGASTGKGAPYQGDINVYQDTQSQKSNVGMYLIIGVITIVVVVGVVMLTRKK